MKTNIDITNQPKIKGQKGLKSRLLKDNTVGGLVFDIINCTLLGLFALATIYPFIYVLSNSLSDPIQVEACKVLLFPKDFTLRAYRQVVQDSRIWSGFLNSIIYTVSATVLDVLGTFCVAYPISKKNIVFKKFWFLLFFVPHYISAGMIPSYMLLDTLGLVDNRLVMILPGLVKVMHLVLVRNYISSLPEALEESAKIDGANQITVLFKIILPLSTPILATIALFKGVDVWNKFMDAIIYLRDTTKHPITVIVWKLLILAQAQEEAVTLGDLQNTQTIASIASLRHAVVIVTILPIIAVYPFLQRYFVKGILLGGVKG